LLDVHVTVGVPVVPSDIVVVAVNPVSSVCPVSRFPGSGTVAFAGEIAIDVTVAAPTVTAAAVDVGAVPVRVKIPGSAAEIEVPPAVFAVNCPGVVVESATTPAVAEVNCAIPVMSGAVPSE